MEDEKSQSGSMFFSFEDAPQKYEIRWIGDSPSMIFISLLPL
jgi:hypothetical protein